MTSTRPAKAASTIPNGGRRRFVSDESPGSPGGSGPARPVTARIYPALAPRSPTVGTREPLSQGPCGFGFDTAHSPAAESMSPTASDSRSGTDCSSDPLRTRRRAHRQPRLHPCWPRLRYASHSSCLAISNDFPDGPHMPTRLLAGTVPGCSCEHVQMTRPLRSTSITDASPLLRIVVQQHVCDPRGCVAVATEPPRTRKPYPGIAGTGRRTRILFGAAGRSRRSDVHGFAMTGRRSAMNPRERDVTEPGVP